MNYEQFFANAPEEFFGTLLQSITETHKSHLKTGKYSDHIALNEFYDEMTELVDTLIEHYQGIYGKIEEYANNFQEAQFESAIEYLEALRDFTRDGREKFCEESELQSCADDILNQIDSTLYKLKELGENKNAGMTSLTEFLKESLLK